tara:strand:- start:430 stop:720 length:291 start_codon:yes stop_codon:yes gene_type:complete
VRDAPFNNKGDADQRRAETEEGRRAMRKQIQHLAPALVAWVALHGNGHHGDGIDPVRGSVIGLQRDQQGWDAANRRHRLVFGSNKAGDYYEGALPP